MQRLVTTRSSYGHYDIQLQLDLLTRLGSLLSPQTTNTQQKSIVPYKDPCRVTVGMVLDHTRI